ncbi:MAG: DUF5103 domain-containing protein [Balneolaceae bacterium]|nr:DUF5103 domain-containing protein [Balneolaceae bacterium]
MKQSQNVSVFLKLSKRIRSGFSLLCLMLFMSLHGCGSLESYQNSSNEPSELNDLFNIPAQIIADHSIRSIQFHREGDPASAPILNLDGNDQLQLRFEHLSLESRQFRVSLTHHNPDWSRSGLPQERFMSGFYNTILNSGELSNSNRPYYRQYSFTFPTEQFQITKSGNYLLKIEDSDTGYLVLTLPFFVSENKGSLRSSVEKLSVPRQNLRRLHRPVSQFILPDFVQQPQFDLEFYFAQNQFWGRTKEAGELDFSAPDHVQFELNPENSFIGDYEFRTLSIDQLSQSDKYVIEAFPTEIPPRLILKDDAEGFGTSGLMNLDRLGPFGNPDMDLQSRYADIVFRFDTDQFPDSTDSIHLLGDFNNWSVSRNNELQFDEKTGRWETNQIIKQGEYKYKYVLIEGSEIKDLYFDEQFTNNRQQYHAFVYLKDPNEFYYRLLQVQSFLSD